jgi:capsule biosynthesis phosphatase
MNYVICAAGEGTRFQSVLSTPKPMILLKGKPLLVWSLRSLPITSSDTVVIVVQKKHRVRHHLEALIRDEYPFLSVTWIELDALTSGQLETVLKAKEALTLNEGLVVFNSDTYFESNTLTSWFADDAVEGVIPCASVEGDSWSFCDVKEGHEVTRVTEKNRISEWGSVGLYYFRQLELFFKYTEAQLKGSVSESEYYVAPLYDRYIHDGHRIVMDVVSLFKPMGTPDQLEEYWGVSIEELQDENSNRVLVVDLDNTLSIETEADYANKLPRQDVIDTLATYRKKGYRVIIHSSRRMRTHQNNEAAVVADVAADTIAWLDKHGIEYDGLRFGKPYAENGFYVDDRTVRPDEFVQMSEDDIFKLLGNA